MNFYKKKENIGFIAFWGVLIAFSTGCFNIENQYSGLAPGPWRATLDLRSILSEPIATDIEGKTYNLEDTPPDYLPFNFEVVYTDSSHFVLEFINGEEHIVVKDIQIGRDKKTNKDTFLIEFPIYDSYIKGHYNERIMEGNWVVKNRSNYSIPFVAKFGKAHRFTQLKEVPKLDISGTWQVTFEDEEGTFPAIGEFQQKGNELTGTFLTETGDYRYLEGTIQKDKIYLSVFDGAHAFLFEAKLLEDNSMVGLFKSGNHYKATWIAQKNDQATLTDPNELTKVKNNQQQLDFTFENTDGQLISINNKIYDGKVKLIQLFGTWCPNCRDETRFLLKYFNEHPTDEIAIIGLAFEKYRDIDKAKQRLKVYKDRMNIPYELLLAGPSDKKEAAKALPLLNQIIAYPTLLFVNRKNQIVKVHTGFSGPATSKYNDYVKSFEQTLQKLIQK